MKKTRRRPSPVITYRMAPKRLVDQRVLPAGVVVIDQEDEPQIEGNFYLDPEDEPAPPPTGGRQEAMTAVIGATFEAATSPDQRRRLRHGQAMCAILRVPTPAWIVPVSHYFRSVFGERWVQQVRKASGLIDDEVSRGSGAVSSALSSGQSVVGISNDISLLPRTLIGAADLAIHLTPPNGAVLKTAVTRFATRAPTEIEDSLAAELDLDDVLAAFRPGTGPQRIVQRLAAAAAALRTCRDLKQERQPCSS
jgi:hypothetical protein